MKPCHACGYDLSDTRLIGRRDTCLSCGTDLHVCANCTAFDPTAWRGQCREPQAEPPSDKNAANACDWFTLRVGSWEPKAQDDAAAKARAALEAIFKK